MKKVLLALGITVILAVLSLATLQIVASTIDTPTPPVAQSTKATAPLQPPTVDELLRLVNEERAKVGVAPLTIDPLLNQSAQMKSEELAREGIDTTPHVNNAGKRGWEYINDVNKSCNNASENLHWNNINNTSKSVVEGWKSSSAHYKAMIDPTYDTTGFGISGMMTTQHFCDER